MLKVLGLVITLGFVCVSGKKLTEITKENCEVCVAFISRFIDTLDESIKSDTNKIEQAVKEKCKISKKDDNRFCYYVGGLDESATGMLGEISKPVSWGMPAEKICMKLYKKDAQICDIKYEKTIDLSTVDLKKLKVKDLKAILSDWDEMCRGCTEKTDFIRLIEELMPKYDPTAAEKRRKIEL